MEKHNDALACFDKVLTLDPTYHDALFYKGIELAEIGNFNDAISIFDEILKKEPKNVNAIYSKSCSKAQLGEDDEALALLAQAISYKGAVVKNWAIKDKFFDKLKDDPRFNVVVKDFFAGMTYNRSKSKTI